ncbi:MAG: hypothetical protein AAGC60_21430 [Acidobacteriota bacterium]
MTRWTAWLLGAILALPSLGAGAVGWHHATHHHADGHAAGGHSADGHHVPESSTAEHAPCEVADVVFHGHHHEETDGEDHSHGSRLVVPSPSVAHQSVAPAVSMGPVVAVEPGDLGLRPREEREQAAAPVPLFTVQCSLLI